MAIVVVLTLVCGPGSGVALAQLPTSPSGDPQDAAAAAPEGQGAPEVDPLLPSEGLLDAAAWRAMASRLLTRVVDAIPGLIAAILVFVVFWILSRITSRLLTRVLKKADIDPGLSKILPKLARYAILIFGIVMAASQAGIAVGSLIAGVGVVGLAIGLAAQDSLSNFVAGFTILWDRPFRIGDNVEIADEFGEVREIGLRTTRLRTPDSRYVVLPNRDVIENEIVNHTRDRDLRLGVPVGIGYGESIEEARQALLQAVAGNERVRDQPQPTVVVTELGDSSVNLELRVWLDDPKQERAVYCELLEAAKVALDQAGIEIPFPQRTLHVAPETPPLHIVENAAAG